MSWIVHLCSYLSYQCKQLATQYIFILPFPLIFSTNYFFSEFILSVLIFSPAKYLLKCKSLLPFPLDCEMNADSKRLLHYIVLTKKSSLESTLEGLGQWQYYVMSGSMICLLPERGFRLSCLLSLQACLLPFLSWNPVSNPT